MHMDFLLHELGKDIFQLVCHKCHQMSLIELNNEYRRVFSWTHYDALIMNRSHPAGKLYNYRCIETYPLNNNIYNQKCQMVAVLPPCY